MSIRSLNFYLCPIIPIFHKASSRSFMIMISSKSVVFEKFQIFNWKFKNLFDILRLNNLIDTNLITKLKI